MPGTCSPRESEWRFRLLKNMGFPSSGGGKNASEIPEKLISVAEGRVGSFGSYCLAEGQLF